MPNATSSSTLRATAATGSRMVMNGRRHGRAAGPHVDRGDIIADERELAFQPVRARLTSTIYFVQSSRPPGATANPNTDIVHICYRYSGAPGAQFSEPTFSPDGNGLAWAAATVHVVAVPTFAAGCTLEGATPPAARDPRRPRARLGPADDRPPARERRSSAPAPKLSLKVLSATRKAGISVRGGGGPARASSGTPEGARPWQAHITKAGADADVRSAKADPVAGP